MHYKNYAYSYKKLYIMCVLYKKEDIVINRKNGWKDVCYGMASDHALGNHLHNMKKSSKSISA